MSSRLRARPPECLHRPQQHPPASQSHLSPNPTSSSKPHHPITNAPHSGKSLNITASGTLAQTIEKGAKAHLSVKYGMIKILTQEVDLCEQSKDIDLSCPIKEGTLELTRTVELPREIPPVCCFASPRTTLIHHIYHF